jgi:proteasome assembly chaperone (PAC2) family protein
MLKGFDFEKVDFKKDILEDCLVVYGEATNRTGKDYSSVVFRIVIFAKNIPLGHVNVTINGLQNGKTRRFEKRIARLTYSQVISKISNYEIYFEGGY